MSAGCDTGTAPRRPRRGRLALRIAGLVVLVLVIARAASQVDAHALWTTLRQIDVGLLLVAVVIGAAVKLAAKIARSHTLVVAVARAHDVAPPPLAVTARLFTGTHALGQLLWPPVGMSLRGAGLVRDGLSVRAAAEVHVGERIAEALALIAFAGVMMIAAPGALERLFGSAVPMWAPIIVAGVAAAILLALSSRRVRRLWTTGWVPLLVSGGFALLSHTGDIAILWLAARCAHVAVSPAALLVAFVAVHSAAIIPLVPGQLGVLEGAVVLGLTYGGVATTPALVVALAYRAAYLAPLLVLGMPALVWDGLARPSARPAPSAAAGTAAPGPCARRSSADLAHAQVAAQM